MSWDRVAEVAVEKDTRAALLAPMWLKKKKKMAGRKEKLVLPGCLWSSVS